ncbi:PTS transporter subunit EIIC, partial [Streptococcus suis]
FSPRSGGLLAALFVGIFFAFLERNIRKFMQSFLDTFLTPLCTVILGGLVALLVIQPIGEVLTTAIYSGLNFVYEKL